MTELETFIDSFYRDHLTRHGRVGKRRLHPTKAEYFEIFQTGMLAQAGLEEARKGTETEEARP